MNPLGEADVLAPGIGGGEGRCFAQLALGAAARASGPAAAGGPR